MSYCLACQRRGTFVEATATKKNHDTGEAEPACAICSGVAAQPAAKSAPKVSSAIRGLQIDWSQAQADRDAGMRLQQIATKYSCSVALVVAKTKPATPTTYDRASLHEADPEEDDFPLTEKDMEKAVPTPEEKCKCGKPARHMGRCPGTKLKTQRIGKLAQRAAIRSAANSFPLANEISGVEIPGTDRPFIRTLKTFLESARSERDAINETIADAERLLKVSS